MTGYGLRQILIDTQTETINWSKVEWQGKWNAVNGFEIAIVGLRNQDIQDSDWSESQVGSWDS